MTAIDEQKRIELLEKYAQMMQAEIEAIERGEPTPDEAEALEDLHGLAYAQQKDYLIRQRRKAERLEAEARAQEEQGTAALEPAEERPAPGALKLGPTLESQYRARLAKLAPGDIHAITALKAEFRKKGLEVW